MAEETEVLVNEEEILEEPVAIEVEEEPVQEVTEEEKVEANE